MAIPIRNNTKKGQIVYDPFGGTGTTLVGCEKLDRKCAMIEIDPGCCDAIINRYVAFCKKNNRPYSVIKNGKKCNDFDTSI
jgi:DNA modification methylase